MFSEYARGSLFASKRWMNTVGDQWVFCSPFDKEVSVKVEADMGKWPWTFHPQADGSYLIRNVKFGGALFCSHKTFETHGVWVYAVGLSPYDKAEDEGEIAGKWRWHIVDTMNGRQLKNVFADGVLHVDESTCNYVDDKYVYVSIGMEAVSAASIFHLNVSSTKLFTARLDASQSEAEKYTVSIYSGLSGEILLVFDRPRDSQWSLREDTLYWLKQKSNWTDLALIDVHVEAIPLLAP